MNNIFEDTAHLFLLDDEGVVFSEPAQALYSLNTAAALVWCWMEEELSGAALASELAGALGVSEAEAAEHMKVLLGEWRSLGFLAGVEPDVPVSPIHKHHPHDASTGMPPISSLPARLDGVEARYRLLGSRLLLRCGNEEQISRVRPVLAHLADPDAEEADLVMDFVDQGDRHLLYLDGEPIGIYPSVEAVAPAVKGVFWRAASARHPHFLEIHAGVVATDDFCILLPASAGSGKSTLTAVLALAGFHYYSDEVALLLDGSLHVPPVPIGICVKAEGIAALAPYYPGLAELEAHQRIDGKTVRYMPPPIPEGHPARPAVPVGAIIFPKYSPDSKTELLTIGKGMALQKLLQECVSVSEPLTVARVERLVRWIADIPCYDLPLSSGDEAAKAVKKALSIGY